LAFWTEGEGILNKELVATVSASVAISTWTEEGPVKGAGLGSSSGGTDPPPKLAMIDWDCCCCCKSYSKKLKVVSMLFLNEPGSTISDLPVATELHQERHLC
jgi:hypothetical protein